jgi:hypothetical protein
MLPVDVPRGGVTMHGFWVLLALAPFPALAVERHPVVVLIDDATLPADAAPALQAALKTEVDASARFQWQDPPPVSMNELLVALSCKRPDVSCLQKMEGVLGADAVIFVSLEAAGKKKPKELTVTLVQFKPTRLARRASEPFADAASASLDLGIIARDLLGPTLAGGLTVETQPPGARVAVDGRSAGITPLTLEGVTPGQHQVELKLDGYQPHAVNVKIRPGVREAVLADLEPTAPPATAVTSPIPAVAASVPKDKLVEPHRPVAGARPWLRPVRWGLVGLGGTMAALAGVGFAGSAVLMAASGLVYAVVLNVQAALKLGNPLVYPLFATGSAVGVAASLLVPIVAAFLVGAYAVGRLA